ncbi:MAG: hypothetical protein SVV03_00730 [Candidatus Nanohaloarchaea archaeon]|nr:hypothetical protein [Candidatus Nanohaloarchaea archaeon]
MGLNYKVVAAVFVTLLAVAMGIKEPGTGVGSLDISVPDSISGLFGKGHISLSPGSGKSNTSLEASFSAEKELDSIGMSESAEEVRLQGRSAYIKMSGLESEVDSIDMSLTNFTGSLEFGDNMTLEGEASSMQFNSLPFNAPESTDVKVGVKDPELIAIEGLEPVNMEFESVSGSFSSGGTTITLEDKPAFIRNFKGEFARNYTSGMYSLRGTVFNAVFGEGKARTSIGAGMPKR